MSDIKLFRLSDAEVTELKGTATLVEKDIQKLIERFSESFLGVKFLASEYSTGKVHGGRIDTLGIDENACPVIIEYKRSVDENVINQGLYYLDWLLDHKAEFKLLVLERYGKELADQIEWSSPRLLCIANNFTKYDEHAVQQINRNIELIRYRKYSDELLLLELVNATTANVGTSSGSAKGKKIPDEDTIKILEQIELASPEVRERWEALKDYLLNLGDDVQMNTLKHYMAFKRFKNFASVIVYPSSKKIVVYVKVEPKEEILEKGFTRDVTEIGHLGTGDLEITISCDEDLERAKPLLRQSYEGN